MTIYICFIPDCTFYIQIFVYDTELLFVYIFGETCKNYFVLNYGIEEVLFYYLIYNLAEAMCKILLEFLFIIRQQTVSL